MIKVSVLKAAASDLGQIVFPLFSSSKADSAFEKRAAPYLRPDVAQYIASLHPVDNAQYVLVNAMGAGEFYSSNINGDWFDESGLIHCPDGWRGIPEVDKILAKDWPYGFPTFYNAHAFAHHRNKDAGRSYGDVELAAWNPRMRRVELVIRVDKDKCDKFDGTSIWDKLKLGQYIDVSMGSKVPWDLCSICTDWKLYKEALATFDPRKHKHPGEAVLLFHKVLKQKYGTGIRGLSITRNDYCEHTLRSMNKILPDGRKVFVYNPFPRFFDISFVFIGADKTAKVMLHIKTASADAQVWMLPGAELAEKLGYESEPEVAKTASVEDGALKLAFLGKSAKLKGAQIEKRGPAQFDAKAIPVLTRQEPSISNQVLDQLAEHPLKALLPSVSSLGIVLRPREFQRIIVVRMGLSPLADELEQKNIMFPKVDGARAMELDRRAVVPAILSLIESLFRDRSGLSPDIDERGSKTVQGIIRVDARGPSSLPAELLNKIGSVYCGYRKGLMDFWGLNPNQDFQKTAGSLSALSIEYLKHAYWNEVGRL